MSSFQILAIADRLANVGEQAGFQAVGMIVVFGCLILLALILTLSGTIASRLNNRKTSAAAAATTKPAAQAAAPAAVPAGTIPAEVIAAISAAVYTAVGGASHRIIDIRQSAGSAYSASGRAEIYASHRITPTRRS